MTLSLEGSESDKIIVNEFCHLLEKSKQLFNGLRDLPQYGHKQWQTYFGRTFDVYTKLWKFQQQHRRILDATYCLKRWQIGEIASKIGQLYYHYYLRTSDTHYLNEAFSFFSAIRSRDYFSRADKDLVVKKFRYYARFIIVCLLLKKLQLVRELTKEFSRYINEKSSPYGIEDNLEWGLVVQEIREFIEADDICTVLSGESTPVVITNRLTQFNCPPVDNKVPNKLQLSEILIVGNCYDQIRFSELTLDMFRILQCLERDPQDNFGNTPNPLPNSGRPQKMPDKVSKCALPSGISAIPTLNNSPDPTHHTNPHKYLLYKPNFSQLNAFMAAGFKDLPTDGVMLLYLSSDGHRPYTTITSDPYRANGYENGGVVTNSRREHDPILKPKKIHLKESHCVHPGDLYAYTRKPFFLIVDSDNSSAFKNMNSLFGQPLVTLLSPESMPTTVESQRQKGNLFTLFLYCPLTAYCFICGLSSISLKTWERGQSIVDNFLSECCRILLSSRNLDSSYLQFLGVDFLRVFILRYCFCSVVMQMHREFRGPNFYPSCSPSLPEADFVENRLLQKLLLDLATLFDSRSYFASANDFSRD